VRCRLPDWGRDQGFVRQATEPPSRNAEEPPAEP
jgi:hypothetical protein